MPIGYIEVTNRKRSIPGWPLNTTRFFKYVYDTVDNGKTQFLTLADTQKLAATTADRPAHDDETDWFISGTSGQSGGTISAISVSYSGGRTVISVTATGIPEVNISALSGGAQWNSPESWYACAKFSGPDAPASGIYQLIWNFPFVLGLYAIRARIVGVTDMLQYVTQQYLSATQGGSVESVSTSQAGNHTLIDVTGTTESQVNIRAVSGGASWDTPNEWYDTVKLSGGDPPARGVRRKDWGFAFVAGTYEIKARKTGTTDASTYVTSQYVSTGYSSGTPPTSDPTPPPFGGTSPDLDTLLGAEIQYSDNGILVVGWNSHPDRDFGLEIVPGSYVKNQGCYVRRTGSYNPGPGSINIWEVGNIYYTAAEISTIWVKCGEPKLFVEYHTRGTSEETYDDARYFSDDSFEISITIL